MKFTKQFDASMVYEWRHLYLDYKGFKRRLDDLVAMKALCDSRGGQVPPLVRRLSAPSSPRSANLQEAVEAWKQDLEASIAKTAHFVETCLKKLERSVDEIARHCKEIFPEDDSPVLDASGKQLELRALKALGSKAEKAQLLRKFGELNHVALFKLLKRFDKKLPTIEGSDELLQQLTVTSNFKTYQSRLSEVEKEIKTLTISNRRLQGLGDVCATTLLNLTVGVGTPPAQSLAQQQALFFFLGTSVGLFIGILVLIIIPPTDSEERPFSSEYFLAPFSVFRVGLSLCLCFWGAGFVANVCEARGINYAYLLELDPRLRLGPRFFFARAAIITSVWILVFGMYVVDYKWLMLFEFGAAHGFNGRSSGHYVCYPSILIIAIAVVALMPSRSAAGADKRGFLKAIGRTMLAPFFVVSFADNLVGDVLTSLVKPMQDVPAMMCYLASSHPQTHINVEIFVERGDTCPEWLDRIAKVLLAASPLWWRSLQCLRRYRDSREGRHLMNWGKYMTALAVALSSAIVAEHALILPMQVIATMYAATWDVGMDWGISPGVIFPRRISRSISRAGHTPSSGAVQRQPTAKMKDRTFHWCTYIGASIFDVLARLTWVQTLVPIHFITTDVVNREIVLVLLGAIEIARRSIWALIRLENEQRTNAGGYRAILWVPDMLQPHLAGEDSDAEEETAATRPRGNTAEFGGQSDATEHHVHGRSPSFQVSFKPRDPLLDSEDQIELGSSHIKSSESCV